MATDTVVKQQQNTETCVISRSVLFKIFTIDTQKTYSANPTMHQFHIPQYTFLQQKCAHVCTFLLLNGALWDDISLMHYGICWISPALTGELWCLLWAQWLIYFVCKSKLLVRVIITKLTKHGLIGIGIPVINFKQSSDRLRFIMGLPIPVIQWFI